MEPTFSDRLKAWLACRSMRPATLAKLVGVERSTINEWLTKQCEPMTRRLPAIAAAFGVSQAEFFGPLPAPPDAGTPSDEAA